MAFEQFVPVHDPNGQEDWTALFKLSPGEQIASAQVDVVDPTSTTVDAGTDLVLGTISIGKLASGEVYDLWGVTVWVTGGAAGSAYYLRWRVATDSSPARRTDRTMILRCAQQ